MIIHQSYHYAHHWILTLLILIAKTKMETYLTICLTLHLRMKHTNEPEVKDFHGPKDIFTWIYILETSSNLTANVFKCSIHAWAFSRFRRVQLCNPMDCSPPGSSVHRIPQSRILDWVATPSSRGSSRCRHWTHISYVSFIDRQVPNH